jgi:hypothetical protein
MIAGCSLLTDKYACSVKGDGILPISLSINFLSANFGVTSYKHCETVGNSQYFSRVSDVCDRSKKGEHFAFDPITKKLDFIYRGDQDSFQLESYLCKMVKE